MEYLLSKVNKLAAWQVASIFVILGFAVFFTGLNNPFLGDDFPQIVNNTPVHSLSNIFKFFQGSTFYFGRVPLDGVYYRPLMVTLFSALYTLFGAHPIAFHIVQLPLHIFSAFFLYLFFKYSFKPALALLLALFFLVHPINSQAVFSIAAIQEPLYFLFGIVSLWLLLRFESVKSLVAVAACLLLSMLSKETGVLFVIMAFLYLALFNRKRLYPFIGIIGLPVALYIYLKVNAVGLSASNPHLAPIDELNFARRLTTAPYTVLLIGIILLFPLTLSTGYYWVNSGLSLSHFWLPVALDFTVIFALALAAAMILRKSPKPQFFTYVFFSIWLGLGTAIHLQIIPMDMTLAETWFYFPMVGLLGIIGVTISNFPLRIRPVLAVAIISILIGSLAVRSALRGLDYRDQYTISMRDIASSANNPVAENFVAFELAKQGKLQQAKVYAERSVREYPTGGNYNTLGAILTESRDFRGALDAYSKGIGHQNSSIIYDNMAALQIWYGEPKQSENFIKSSLKKFPQDPKLWLYLAILEYNSGDYADAKTSITNANNYGLNNKYIYNHIMNSEAFSLSFPKLQ